jgi:hypothetical protein
VEKQYALRFFTPDEGFSGCYCTFKRSWMVAFTKKVVLKVIPSTYPEKNTYNYAKEGPPFTILILRIFNFWALEYQISKLNNTGQPTIVMSIPPEQEPTASSRKEVMSL